MSSIWRWAYRGVWASAGLGFFALATQAALGPGAMRPPAGERLRVCTPAELPHLVPLNHSALGDVRPVALGEMDRRSERSHAADRSGGASSALPRPRIRLGKDWSPRVARRELEPQHAPANELLPELIAPNAPNIAPTPGDPEESNVWQDGEAADIRGSGSEPQNAMEPKAAEPWDDAPRLAAPRELIEDAEMLEGEAGNETLPADEIASGLLPLAEATPRSPELDSVGRAATAQVRRGFDLAARGAHFSARQEFVQALSQLSSALDANQRTDFHGRALAAGLRALAEAEDFVPSPGRLEVDLDVPAVVASHRTPVLHDESRQVPPLAAQRHANVTPRPSPPAPRPLQVSHSLSPLVAQQRYYTYAQEQLGVAAGQEPAGSLALYGLGKLYSTLADDPAATAVAADAKAMVYYQAALSTDPRNFLASHELAVEYVNHGRLELARGLLLQSLAVSRRSETWRNLAVVHKRLGELQLAELAENEAHLASQLAERGRQRPATAGVRFVAPEQFAGTVRAGSELQPPAGHRKQEQAVQPREAAPAREAKARSWLPWSR